MLGKEVFFVYVLPIWEIYFDGDAWHDDAGIRVVLVFPKKHILPYSFALTKLWFDNIAEYQVLILGLQMAIEIAIKVLDVYGDTLLVISQLLEKFGVKKDDINLYHKHALWLLDRLETVMLEHIPRDANKIAYMLANLATTLAL